MWRSNTAEVMGTDRTSPEVVDRVIAFAKAIGMVPVPLKKEKAGYVLNSLLVPFLGAALELVAGGYATPEVVDTTWCTATGAPMGPMRLYDVIGLETPYNILAAGGEKERAGAAWLKREYLDKGWLGRASGRGFYTYDS